MTAAARRHEVGWDRLYGRLHQDVHLPMETVRRLRPHAARRATTVPLIAIEIVEASLDQGRVASLVEGRPDFETCDAGAARFSLGYAASEQLYRLAGRRKGGALHIARAIVEAALDGGAVDDLLRGRFDRGESRPAPPRPVPPPAPAMPLPVADPNPDQATAMPAREREPGAAAPFAPPRWRLILAEVSTKHGVHIDDILEPGRRGEVIPARFEAAYRMWRELGMSLVDVGRRLGERDHTSALHAIRTHAARFGLPLERSAPAGSPRLGVVGLTATPSVDPVAAPADQSELRLQAAG